MANKKRFTDPVEIQEIIDKYNDGYSLARLEREYYSNDTTIKKLLIKNNIEIRSESAIFSKTELAEREKKVLEAYAEGLSVKKICQKLHCNDAIVSEVLRKYHKTRIKKLTEEDRQKIKNLYSEGVIKTKIAKIIECSTPAVSYVIKGTYSFKGVQSGTNSPNYKKDRKAHPSGYLRILINKDDIYASMRTKRGYILEHRYVMACHLKRPLIKGESVHHLNGNKSDNRIENLQLRVGNHGKGQAYCCGKCGSVRLTPVEI